LWFTALRIGECHDLRILRSDEPFPAVGLDEWCARAGVEAVPRTPLADGLSVPWLYTRADALPRLVPGLRGARAWDIRQEHALGGELLEDLEGGVTAIALRVPPGTTLDALDAGLAGVLLDLAPVRLDAGAHGIAAAETFLALWRRRGHDPRAVAAALGVDPLGAGVSPDAAAGAFAARVDAVLAPSATALAADTRPYAEAGATAAHELALLIATATAYLRACEAAGLPPERAAARIELTLSVDADQFLGIAKLRAARRMWARVLDACGVEDGRSPLYARTNARMLAAVDPWVNLLRATTAAFAAAVGGADGITVIPFDAPRGADSRLGRRIARNTQLILLEEAHLARVADPGGGAWYVERLTDDLAHAAWTKLQAIERAGGLLAALRSGAIAAEIAAAAADRAERIDRREQLLTGVTAFPLLGDDGLPPTPEPQGPAAAAAGEDDAPRDGATAAGEDAGPRGDRAIAAAPLVPVRDSRPFELLRARAGDASVLLACVGPIARHTAAATWARSFFESGGIRAHASDPLETPEQASAALDGHRLAVLCAAPDEDPATLRPLAGALRAAGARRVYLAHATPEQASAADADEGIDDGQPMTTILEAALAA